MHGEAQPLFQIVPSLVVGGAERLVVNLLLHLNRRRYAPVAICLEKPLGTHYETALQQAGIPLYFLGKGSGANARVYRQLQALFRQYRPTVVHTHIIGLNYAYPLMLLYRTPVRVHTIHSLAPKEMGVRVGKWVRLLAFRYRIGRVVPVAVAAGVQRTIEQLYGYRNAPLIPNGIPTDEYAPDMERRLRWRAEQGLEPHAMVITTVGRLVALKNHALLMRAFAQLRASVPLYLLIVGTGEQDVAIRQQVEALRLSERVRLLGQRSDVPAILNASDIFVLSSRVEGNPLSVQEAMASGLPVVATAVGGVPELVEDGISGLLVPSEDESALTHALQTLIDQPGRRQQMGIAARQRAVAHFDIRHTVRRYEALYEALLQGGHPTSPDITDSSIKFGS